MTITNASLTLFDLITSYLSGFLILNLVLYLRNFSWLILFFPLECSVINLSLKSRKIQSTNNLKLINMWGWTVWSTDFQISISNAACLCDEFFYIGNGWHILGWSGILNLNIGIYLTITLINFCWKRKPYDPFGKSRLRKSRQLLSLISRLSNTYNLSGGKWGGVC